MLSPSRLRQRVSRTAEDQLARESDVTVSTYSTPHAEYRGFFIYVLASVLLFVVVVWMTVPDAWLRQIGISYYPDKYWTHAIPSFLIIVMIYMYVFVILVNNEVKTLKLDDMRTLTDEHAVYPEKPEEYIWKAPSGVWDLPIGLVNEVLYE